MKKPVDSLYVKNNMKTLTLIDVRSPWEFKHNNIEGSVNIPIQILLSSPEKYLDMKLEYYTICNYGGRSSQAAKVLAEKGYDITFVKGGINYW